MLRRMNNFEKLKKANLKIFLHGFPVLCVYFGVKPWR